MVAPKASDTDARRVWFVSSGSYSDYGVERVFATRLLAQEYAGGDDDNRFVEPDNDEGYVVVSALPEPIEHLTLTAVVRAGGVEGESERHKFNFPGLDNPEDPIDSHSYVYAGYGSTPSISIHVEGIDIDRVKKVYTELRARTIAEFDVLVAAEMALRAQRGY